MPKGSTAPVPTPFAEDEEFDPDASPFAGANAGTPDAEDDDESYNLEDAEERKFTTMPPGVYDAIVDNCELEMSTKGNKMLTWTFKIVNHPEFAGRTLRQYTVLAADQFDRLKKMLKTIDPTIPLTAFRPRDGWVPYLAKPCTLKVRTKYYEGSLRNNITAILPARAQVEEFLPS
jgi:hypothetical protein